MSSLESQNQGAACFCCSITGLRALAIFGVTSLCLAKEHKNDKERVLISVWSTMGKARVQEQVQERQGDDLEKEMCGGLI